MSTQIELEAWSDLTSLADRLDERAADLAAIAGYARRWMCQSAGFEPSPLCLLRPLVALVDGVAEAFLDLERIGVADLATLRQGVDDAAADLGLLDRDVAARMPRVA